MISLITRIQYKDHYERLVRSVGKTAISEIEFLSEHDKDGLPHIAATYNRLGKSAKGDILVFCHDDIEFIESCWDARLIEFFAEHDYDVAGVIGVDKYAGGLLVTLGNPHCFGKFINRAGDEMRVNIYNRRQNGTKMAAIDGMFMAVRADHFKSEKFDEQFDELYFYDIDYCLRAKTGLIDIMLAHHKMKDKWGKYPPNMRPIEDYEPAFYSKHGLRSAPPIGETRCACASQEDYAEVGHDEIFKLFEEKYLNAAHV